MSRARQKIIEAVESRGYTVHDLEWEPWGRAVSAERETKLFLPCGCVANCTVLAVDRWQWEPGEEWWFEVYTRAGERASLWWRIKQAAKVALGRDHYFHALCFSDQEIQVLRDFIDSRMPVALSVNANTQTTWSTFPQAEEQAS